MSSPGVQGHGRPRRVVNPTARESSSAAQIPVGILWGVTLKSLVPRAESVIKAKNRLREGTSDARREGHAQKRPSMIGGDLWRANSRQVWTTERRNKESSER